MPSTRIIDCIGASNSDIVRLSLLLQAAADRLADFWEWGPEEEAEVVLIYAGHRVGAAALHRCRMRGVIHAQLIDADAPEPDGLFLRRPVELDDLVVLLNEGMKSTVVPLALITLGDDFFNMDFDAPTGEGDLPTLAFTPPSTASDRNMDGIESVFRRDPLADKPQFLMPDKLGDRAGVEYIQATTARSAARADVSGNPFLKSGFSDASIDPSFRHDIASSINENETHPLTDYLDRNLLGGPARIRLLGAPPLVLDPKEQLFHAEGKLPALEPYCRQQLRLGDWERLINADLLALRRRVPARPYLRLVWMDRYINSNGYLATHLDPGGSYRITRWIELAQDYPRAFRVAAKMASPLRLDEIARMSDVPLGEVFNVVNAYEAIGYVEWTHRPRTLRGDS